MQNLEQGDLNLEESMTLFERGLHLSQHNQEKLKGAEQQIHILLERNGQAQLEKFNTDETISSD